MVAETIQFPNGNSSRLVTAPSDVDVAQVVTSLELSSPRALFILNGGTADFADEVKGHLEVLMASLARFFIEEKITVITGGTNAGVFKLLGEAFGKLGGPVVPCIGISVTGRVWLSRLEPHHSHFVLVEGKQWGEETGVMYKLAELLATERPSVAVFAGGGKITITEMLQNVAQNREMILISGSGGSTDAVLAALIKGQTSDELEQQIITKGRITAFAIDQPVAELTNLMRRRLLNNMSPNF